MSWLGNFDDFGQDYSPVYAAPGNQQHHKVTTGFHNNAVERMRITDLVAGTPNINIVGLVIAKEEPREVSTKVSSGCGSSKFALSFVLRDSVSSYISATCWGSEGHIKDLAKGFHISEIVKVYNPQVQTKPTNGPDRFRPWTPSPFHLNLSEHHSVLKVYQEWDSSNYSSLQHIPIRPANDFYSLNDIISNGQRIGVEHVNLLAAIKRVGPVREIVTKKGRHTKRCEITLFDETCSSFSLVLWDEETISQAVQWNPAEYVISAVEVRVYFDNFRSCMTATADSKTIFIVNPDTKEAHKLYIFAQSQPVDAELVDNIQQQDPEISEVKDLRNISSVKMLEQQSIPATGCPYFCIVYCYITQFDIDCDNGNLIRYRCPKCKRNLEHSQQVCLNPSCIENSTSGKFSADVQYDIPVTLSDHTGSLANCRLSNSTAEEMIGIQVQRSRNTGKVFYRVLSCTLADPGEVQRHFEQLILASTSTC